MKSFLLYPWNSLLSLGFILLPRISEIHFALNILIDSGSQQKLLHSIDQCSINMSKGSGVYTLTSVLKSLSINN